MNPVSLSRLDYVRGLSLAVFACAVAHAGCKSDSSAGDNEASLADVCDGPIADSGPVDGAPDCGAESIATNQLPDKLSCTGLYSNIKKKELGDRTREYTPAHVLWSDGAEKYRWIYLPECQKIDTSDPESWIFPIGTRLFKEFNWKGHRVETRVFWKIADNRWLKAAYHWNDDETEATRFAGGDVDVAGDSYYIPSAKECDQCHKGRLDRALGFEQILLGLEGAEGLTLHKLIVEDRLTDPPKDLDYSLGDDGTGKSAAALAYMHVNCGISCHNGNSASEGYSSDLRLRLPVTALDGRSPKKFEPYTTTIQVGATTPRWSDRVRIVPGSPEDSLLYTLITTRDPASPKDQMPPVASRVVDEEGVKAIKAWIKSLPAK